MLDVKLKLRPGHTSERAWMEPASLEKLYWNVTYACNHRCPICFTDSGQPRADELTTAEAVEMLTRARAAGVRGIIISGGEPFARPDVVDILTHMARLGICARIATNGTLLTDELLDRIQGEGLARSFQISLDSLDPQLYARTHGAPPAALTTTLRILAAIQARGFHTTVSVRLTSETLPGIPALLDRAQAEGWPTVTVHCPLHTRRARGALPQDADVLTLLRPVFEHFCGLADQWLVETYIPWAPYHPVVRRFAGRIRFVHRGCRADRDRLSVHPTGEISPCVCLDVPAAYLGNVRRDDLGDVFRSAPLCDMLRHPQQHGICADCPNVADCGGGCRAAGFAVTGRLDGQDEACPVWQLRPVTGRVGTDEAR